MLNVNSEIRRGSLAVLVGEPRGQRAVAVTHGRLPGRAELHTPHSHWGWQRGLGGYAHPCAVLHPALDVLLEPPADPIQKRTGPWCSSLKLQKLRSFKRKGCREARGVFPKRSHESRCEQTNCFCLFLLIFSEQFMLSVNLLLELFFSEALETTTQTPVRSRGGWMRFKKQK